MSKRKENKFNNSRILISVISVVAFMFIAFISYSLYGKGTYSDTITLTPYCKQSGYYYSLDSNGEPACCPNGFHKVNKVNGKCLVNNPYPNYPNTKYIFEYLPQSLSCWIAGRMFTSENNCLTVLDEIYNLPKLSGGIISKRCKSYSQDGKTYYEYKIDLPDNVCKKESVEITYGLVF